MSQNVDTRSIGELLLDADLIARRALVEVQGQDGPPMVATFDEVVHSAARLWGALPAVAGGGVAGTSMRQLLALSESMHRSQTTVDWPPAPTTRDARWGAIADTFERATQLARSSAGKAAGGTERGQVDLAAARARIMHTLYVGAHATGMAVREHVHDTELLPQKRISMRQTRGIPRGQEAAGRLATFEQLAGNVIGNRFADTVAGQYQTSRPGQERLRFAMIDWDIRAHKVLGESPSLASLHLIAQTQAGITVGSRVITRAAHEQGLLATDSYQHRIEPALQAADTAWSGLTATIGQLLQRAESPPADLGAAAAEVRAALFEVAYDKSTWASPAVIAPRVNLNEITDVVSHAIAASADVAGATQRSLENSDDLRVTARGVAGYAATLPVEQRAGIDLKLSAHDLQTNPSLRVPDAIRTGLLQRAERVTQASGVAAGATGNIAQESTQHELTGARSALAIAERNVTEARQHVVDLLVKLKLPTDGAAGASQPAQRTARGTGNVREHLARQRANRAAATGPSATPLGQSPSPDQRPEPRSPHL